MSQIPAHVKDTIFDCILRDPTAASAIGIIIGFWPVARVCHAPCRHLGLIPRGEKPYAGFEALCVADRHDTESRFETSELP